MTRLFYAPVETKDDVALALPAYGTDVLGASRAGRMPFDEALAGRLRRLAPFATEKRMFGGMGLMEDGKMVAGVSHDDLVVRVLPQETELRLREPGAHEMMPGRAMRGWVKVRASALADDRTLRAWVERSRAALRGNGEGKPRKAPLRRVRSRSRRDRARAAR